MKGCLFIVVAAASLLLCLTAAALWVRSYSGSDYVSRRVTVRSMPEQVESQIRRVQWTRGHVWLASEVLTVYPRGEWAGPGDSVGWTHWGHGRMGPRHVGWDAMPRESAWNRMGFAVFEGGMSTSWSDERTTTVAFPAWLPAAAFAVLPTVWVGRAVQRRGRRRRGLCGRCGYDLRASGGRCPECGATAGAAGSGVTRRTARSSRRSDTR